MCEAEDDGRQDDEADVEEDRYAQDEGGRGDRRDDAVAPEDPREAVGEGLGAAGRLDGAPEHGAQPHDHGDGPQGLAHAVEHGLDDVAHRDAGGQGEHHGDQDHGHEGAHPGPDDQNQQDGDRSRREEEKDGGGHGRPHPLAGATTVMTLESSQAPSPRADPDTRTGPGS